MTTSESQRAQFDPIAATYSDTVEQSIAFAGTEHEFFTRRKVEHLLALCTDLVGDPRNATLLDVGCGIGLTDRLLHHRVGRLYGIDLAHEAVARAAASGSGTHYLSTGAPAIALRDASVDLAFAICVLHHVPPGARGAFFSELRRVVRPGGFVVIFEHNPINPLTRVAVSRCAFDEDAVLIGRRSMERLLRDNGFRIERSAYILFATSERIAPSLDRALPWCALGAQYYVAGRREASGDS